MFYFLFFIFYFDSVWLHTLEHKAVLDSNRRVPEFWTSITAASIACEVGPVPTYETTQIIMLDG